MRMAPHSMMPGDADAIRGVQLQQGTLRRVWVFARPYKSTIVIFLVAILAAALLALVAPFVFKAIIDTAIPQGDKRQIAILAAIAVGAAIADAGLAIVQRWCSARVGEGLIYDLRRAVFGHVQQMPVAFFTRTQTGALISRLNNDVVGAQKVDPLLKRVRGLSEDESRSCGLTIRTPPFQIVDPQQPRAGDGEVCGCWPDERPCRRVHAKT